MVELLHVESRFEQLTPGKDDLMRLALTPQAFVDKWRRSTLKESAAYQEHFGDLCRLVGHETPPEHDPTGANFAFQKGVTKEGGEQGFADVWYRRHFAWEYKGPHGNLDKAYQQLLQYREALENPPLLIVSDMETIRIHSNFTNSVKRVVALTLDDLLRPEGLNQLRDVFYNPEAFRSPLTPEQATVKAATQFARIAELRRKYGDDPRQIAHFLIRLLFCLFAEDIGLLPKRLFSELIRRTKHNPPAFLAQLRPLFAAMAGGGYFGLEEIRNFDGRLFDSDLVLPLDSDSMDLLAGVCDLDWSSIEPSVFGTLFERSLDPSKRAQLGAHYTSKEDILLIVEPVLMAPLRRRWAEVQKQALELAARRDEVKGARRTKLQGQIQALLTGFAGEIAGIRVLDAAGGSGNFLYVALKLLLDLEKEVGTFAVRLGLTRLMPTVSPAQLHGIEVNEYACELAQATIWIGYLQWLVDNGYGFPADPILKPLDNIRRMDAILAYDEQGNPVEPEWPEAEVIIGNPPFLGGKKLRTELGDRYVDNLFVLYADRVPREADLVCYWFEKARAQIVAGKTQRAGLLATNSIRQQQNRLVLQHIKETGDIFMAWSDRPWVLDGAAVRVSMVGFDNGSETILTLNGRNAPCINTDLTATADVTRAGRLQENSGIVFFGLLEGRLNMPTMRDLLSAGSKGNLVSTSLQPGQILCLYCKFIDPPNDKYSIYTCPGPKPLFLFINTRPAYFLNEEEAQKTQIKVTPSEYPFLRYVSFVDCERVIEELAEHEIKQQLMADDRRIKGRLSPRTIKEVIWAVGIARGVEPRQREKIIKYLSEAI